MRLIDADSLLGNLDRRIQGTAREYLKYYQTAVKEEPAAYDVDEVVERLDRASDSYECDEQGREHVQMVDLADAVEIVRTGGKMHGQSITDSV